MKAAEVTIQRGSVVAKASGSCYLLRGRAVSERISRGIFLKDGDVLELGSDCYLQISADDRKYLELRQRDGRFFKLLEH